MNVYLLNLNLLYIAPTYFSLFASVSILSKLYRKQRKGVLFWIAIALMAIAACTCVLYYTSAPLARMFLFIGNLADIILLGCTMFIITLVLPDNVVDNSRPIDLFNPKAITETKRSQAGGLFLILLILVPFFPNSLSILPDLPRALSGQFQTISGSAEYVHTSQTKTHFEVDNKSDQMHFEISNRDFTAMSEGKSYTIYYLPDSEYVTDIKDANGTSLLKK